MLWFIPEKKFYVWVDEWERECVWEREGAREREREREGVREREREKKITIKTRKVKLNSKNEVKFKCFGLFKAFFKIVIVLASFK